MLVALVAHQWPQMPDQQFVRGPELRWVLDWETALWSRESSHALMELDFNDLRVPADFLPGEQVPHVAALRMLGEEVPVSSI